MKTMPLNSFYDKLFSADFFIFDPKEPYFQEKLLQAIWNEQILHPELVTAAHEKLEIIYPGTWNVESGPDFHDAVIQLNGQLRRGAIEIHRSPENWNHHQHQGNPEYADVILHVVWQNPRNHSVFPENVPLCVLEGQLTMPLAELIERIDLTAYPYARQVAPGSCAEHLARLSDVRIQQLLQAYGLTRLLRKARSLGAEIAAHGLDAAAYRGMADVMGYKSNRRAFADLTAAVPLKNWNAVPATTAKAILFGAAGLLPDPSRDPILPRHAKAVRQLWDLWWPQRKIPHVLHWNRHRLRPTNGPERRVLALHLLLSQLNGRPGTALIDLFRQQEKPRACLAALRRCLTLEQEEETSCFLHFGADLTRPASLLGASRRRDLIVNLAIPLCFAWGMLQGDTNLCRQARDVLAVLPRLQDNRRFKEAAHHFFVPPSRVKAVVPGACAQLGLLELFQSFHLQEQ